MVTGPASAPAAWTRFSLLKRHPDLSGGQFRDHYLNVHGPLAASTAGFRKYSLRYVQNHVEAPPVGDPAFDGITATTQVPRADYYSQGFFREPDYAAVKDDEIYLFDLRRTVSVLGERVGADGAPAGHKAMVLTGADWQPEPGAPDASAGTRLHRLDRAGASALGFGGASFAHAFLVECWFAASAGRAALMADPAALFGVGAIALAVREMLIFGPEKPWQQGSD